MRAIIAKNPMTRRSAESLLPPDIRAGASLRGSELAWPVNDIPLVIRAARAANLLNIGGQLQFRLATGETCECYWVEIDTYRSVDKSLPWQERIERAADAALRDFSELTKTCDFLDEGRKALGHILGVTDQRITPSSSMCFVWYVLDEKEALDKNW